MGHRMVAVITLILMAACSQEPEAEVAEPAPSAEVASEEPSPADLPAGGDPDRLVYGWYMGMPIRPTAIVPPYYGGEGPEAPADDVPDLTVYLVGPVDDRSPVGPSAEIPRPDGTRQTLPPHQQTHDRLVDESQPHDAIGTFVVPGDAATPETVRTREEPANSVVGAPLAYEIKMGELWVPLSNHVAIQYGLDRGLLTTVPFEYGGLMWTGYVDDREFALDCAVAAASATPPAPEGPDRMVYGWYLGMPVRPTAIVPPAYGGTGPEAPADDVPDLTVYLVGPVDDTSPAAPARENIPTPQGPRNLPAHQQTHDLLATPDQPHDAIGTFVVPGPEATPETVHTREAPANSVVGAPLAYEILVGDVWTKLNNHVVIQYGLDGGLLELVPFEYGGLMWQSFDDPGFWVDCAS